MLVRSAAMFLGAGLLAGCQTGQGPRNAAAMGFSGSSFQRRGEAQGTVSPRMADCYAHCERAFSEEPDSKTASEQQASEYGFGCISRCVVDLSDRAGLPCFEVMGAESPSEWQELYLARGLVEKAAFCVREVGDTSASSQALLSAVEREHQTPASKRALKQEREALLSGDARDAKAARVTRRAANGSAAFRAALEVYQGWSAPEELAPRMFTCLESLPARVCGHPGP